MANEEVQEVNEGAGFPSSEIKPAPPGKKAARKSPAPKTGKKTAVKKAAKKDKPLKTAAELAAATAAPDTARAKAAAKVKSDKPTAAVLKKAPARSRKKPTVSPPEEPAEATAAVEAGAEPVTVVAAAAAPVTVLQGAQVRMGATRQVAISAPDTNLAQAVQPVVGILKVRNIDATLRDITSHLIPNKVIVQGFVHLQIFFVTPDEVVRHLAEDVPFNAMLDIPGAEPGMNVVVQPVIAAVLFHLNEEGTVLVKKIIVDVFAKVVEEVQLRPAPGTGPVLLLAEVVGEGTVQTLVENFVTLVVPAQKVDEIRGEIRDLTSEVIADKVIIQGTIHKQVFFVGQDNVGRHQAEDIHFSTFVDIPGAAPGMDVEVHPRIETIIFELLDPFTLRQKVVIELFVKVTTPIEFAAALGEGPLLRVPELIGQGSTQILQRNVFVLDRPALKIREITAVLTNLRRHVIANKAILQGTIHKQIFFIGLEDGIEYHQAEDVPFAAMVDIPGAAPGQDLIAAPIIESIIFHLLSPTELEQKVIINVVLTVVEQRQLRLVEGAGPLVKVERVIGENLRQVLVRLINQFPVSPKSITVLTVETPVQGIVTFRQQVIVENEVALPLPAIKVAEVSAVIEDLTVQAIPSGLLVQGNVVKNVKFVGEDGMVRNITEVVPFSIIINIPDIGQVTIDTIEVQIEQILFNLSPDGLTVRQVIVLNAEATVSETTTETFTVVSELVVPGLTVQSVQVQALVQTPGGLVLQQFPVITGFSGPGAALLVNPVFGVHQFQVVGDGVQSLNVLESVTLLDP